MLRIGGISCASGGILSSEAICESDLRDNVGPEKNLGVHANIQWRIAL